MGSSLFTSLFKYVLVIAGIFLVINLLANRYIDTQRYDKKVTDFLAAANDLEILVLGNSYGQAIHIPTMQRSGYFLGNPAGDIAMSARLFHGALPLMGNLKYVVMAISPGYIGLSKAIITPQERTVLLRLSEHDQLTLFPYSSEMFSRYITTPFVELNNYFRSRMVGNYKAYNDAGYNQSVVCRRKFGDWDTLHEYGVVGGYQKAPMNDLCLRQLTPSAVMSHYLSVDASQQQNSEVWLENVQSLKGIADNLHKTGGYLLLVTPPLFEAYYDSPSMRRLQLTQDEYMHQLIAHPAIRYFDYHQLLDSAQHPTGESYFADPSHVTLDGAIHVSRQLKREIEVLDVSH